MKGKITLLLTAVTLVSSIVLAQQKKAKSIRIPSFTISIPYWSRTSRYDYRIVKRGSKQFLEMRQTGKKKWARVEDVTCTRPGDYKSKSFDYEGICK